MNQEKRQARFREKFDKLSGHKAGCDLLVAVQGHSILVNAKAANEYAFSVDLSLDLDRRDEQIKLMLGSLFSLCNLDSGLMQIADEVRGVQINNQDIIRVKRLIRIFPELREQLGFLVGSYD